MMKVYVALFAWWWGIFAFANSAASAVTLTGTARTATGLQFTVTTESHTNYFIERSDDLRQWRPVLTNRNAATTATVSVPTGDASGYYRVRAARPFMHALAANRFIDLSGRNMRSDSYNSTNALRSTNGLYDPMKSGDRGDVAAILGLTNSLEVGNAKIYGHLWTGVGGSAVIGAQGIVGSIAWHLNNGIGIEPGWHREYTDLVFAPVVLPDLAGAYSISPGTIGGTNYVFLLESYKYRTPRLSMTSGTMLVTGHATLHVVSDLNISGTARIVVAPSGSLRVYAGGPTVGFAGNGVVNQTGRPLRFQYYGLSSNIGLTLTGNGDFTGTIYAPNADVTLGGGGSSSEDFSGAIVARTVTMDGNL
jgi:hypothetical protein